MRLSSPAKESQNQTWDQTFTLGRGRCDAKDHPCLSKKLPTGSDVPFRIGKFYQSDLMIAPERAVAGAAQATDFPSELEQRILSV